MAPIPRGMTEPTFIMTRTCVLVLGMHRSGTSMTAGILSKLGCDSAANLMPANFANESGYFESHPIAAFNDRLLASSGSSWNDFQKVPSGWFSSPHAVSALSEASELLDQEFGASALFVLKDPRMCRLMPFWRDVFEVRGIRPLILHVHRSPLAVAASLGKRDELPWEYCFLMWLRNVLEAEHETRGLTRHFVSYENLLANWGRETSRAAEAFGFDWPRLTDTVAGEISGFTTRDLRHHDHRPEEVVENPALSEWLRDTFAIHESWAQGGEDPAGRDRLDAIRDAYDCSMPAFAGIVKAMLEDRSGAEQMSAELKRHRDMVEDLSKRSAASEKETAYWRETSADLHQQIEQAGAEATRRDRNRKKELAELRNALTEQEAARAAAKREATAEKEKFSRAFRDEIASMTAAHKEQTEAIARRHGKYVLHLEEELEAALAEKQRLEQDCAAASDHRDLLLSSSSWRITAPLRRLTEFVRSR